MKTWTRWRCLLWLMLVPLLVSAQADQVENEVTTPAAGIDEQSTVPAIEVPETASEASNNDGDEVPNGENETSTPTSDVIDNVDQEEESTTPAGSGAGEGDGEGTGEGAGEGGDGEGTGEGAGEGGDGEGTGEGGDGEGNGEGGDGEGTGEGGDGEGTGEGNGEGGDGEGTGEGGDGEGNGEGGDGEGTGEGTGEGGNGESQGQEGNGSTEESGSTAGAVEGGGNGEGSGGEGGGEGEEGGAEGGGEEVTGENAAENTTVSVDAGSAEGNGTETSEVPDGGGEVTEEAVAATTVKVTTTEPSTTTTTPAGLQCGVHSDAIDGACECQDGWVRDPSDLASTSCTCSDLCRAPNGMACPSGSQCYHITCNLASCRCQDNQYYNPATKTCIDPCAYFGDAVCGLGSDRTCQVSGAADVGYTCPCAAGYSLLSDTCVDVNECNAAQPCGANEECVDENGGHLCPCMQGYLRAEDGSCKNINECLNPRLHDCDHLCDDVTPGFTCSCYNGYSWDETLRECKLDNETTSCECSDPEKSICYQPADGEPECHPKPGYQLLNGTYTDKLECEENVNEWCGVRGICIEGIGSSVCQCEQGYINDTINSGQCIEIVCPAGTVLSGSDCVEPCSLVSCTSPMRCVVASSGLGECVCGTLCQGLLQPQVNTSLYYGAFVITTASGGEDTASKVTTVLNAYFGENSVEVLEVILQNRKRSADALTNMRVEFVVMTDRPNMTEEVSQVIRGQCQSSGSASPDTCVLPGGLVVRESSITVETKDPCEDNPCPSDLFQCTKRTDITGRFICTCKDGYLKMDVPGTPGYCKDVDECNATESPCTRGKECINTPGDYVCRSKPRPFLSDNMLLDLSIAFGVLFCVTFLIAVGLGYLLLKRSHRVRELVPMTETSPGFENHAFHK